CGQEPSAEGLIDECFATAGRPKSAEHRQHISQAMTDHWDKDAIGVSYTYLKNLIISEDKPFRNEKCIIRRGILITSARSISK
ncbi:MAG: hypothetical protein ACI39T_03695, partial [Candidatus Cryptobacteroides sp.]